jgi:hypothetical protein
MKALRFRSGTNLSFMAWLFEGIGSGVLANVVEELPTERERSGWINGER